MRKTIITLVIIALVWIGYIAWPLYELAVMVRAIDNRDLATVARHVNFDRVRVSLTEQVVAAYMRRSGIKPNLLAEQAVAGISIWNPIVNKLVSPKALSQTTAFAKSARNGHRSLLRLSSTGVKLIADLGRSFVHPRRLKQQQNPYAASASSKADTLTQRH
jgi:hypothetical protein